MAGHRTALIVALLALALLAPAAEARSPLEQSQRIAAQAYKAPCPISVRTDGLDNYSNFAEFHPVNCQVRLRSEWTEWTREELCLIVVHEYGHSVLGPAHASEGVMAEDPKHFAACNRLGTIERKLARVRHALRIAHKGRLRTRERRLRATARRLQRRLIA